MTIAAGSDQEISTAEAVEKARAARRAGNREEALLWFRVAAEADPGDARIRWEIASELRELRRFGEAEAVYHQILALDARHAPALRGLGLMARQRGDRAQALERFEAAVAAKPDDLWSLQEMATELRDLGRFTEAEAAYMQAIAADAGFAPALRGLGLVARQRGDRDEALARFRAAAAAKPDDLWSHQEAATELRDLRLFDEAEAAYAAVLALDPKFAPALRGLGLVARLQGDREAALAHFQAAAAARPSDLWSHQEAATELRELGRFEEAEAAYAQALGLDAGFGPALRGLGLAARQRGDRDEALQRFQVAAEARPNDPASHLEIATELRELGRFEEARDAYAQALGLDAGFAPALRGLGIVARQYGDREEALAHFREAAAKSPDIWLGQDVTTELIELGRFEEAEATARAILLKRPRSARAWVLFAQCARHRLSAGITLRLLKRAVAVEPEETMALMALAGEYQRRSAFPEARRLYEQVLTLDATRVPAALEMTTIAARLEGGRLDVSRIRAAASGLNFNEGALIACARELGMRKAFDEAEACLAEIMARFPIHYAARMQAAALKRLSGDVRGAYRHYARVAGHYPRRPEPLVEMAADALNLGNPADAIRSLALALKIRPGFAPALRAVAQLAMQSDQVETALALYRKALKQQPHAIPPATGAAQCLANLGRTEEYDTLMHSLLQRHGVSPPVLNAKANIELSLGRYDEARATAEALRAASASDFGSLVTRITVYLRIGDLEAAEKALAQAPAFSEVNQDKLRVHAARYALCRWRPEIALELLESESGVVSAAVRNDDLAARSAFLAGRWKSLEKHLHSQLKSAASYRQLRNLPAHISQSHLGQLLDEARLEPEAGERISAIHDLPRHARLGEAITLAKTYPDYTPAAICFFIELRRRGRLAVAHEGGGSDHIPRQIVQYWDAETPPADVLAYCATWPALNPGFAYKRFCEDEARAFLEREHAVEVLEAFDRAPEPAMKADLFRLAYLLRVGGYYADADDRCLAAIDSFVPKSPDLVLYQEDLGTIGNDFIGVVPGHPVISRALDAAVQAIQRNDNDILWLSTGPGLLTRTCAAIALEDGQSLEAFLAATHIFDNHEMRCIFAPHCTASYKYSSKHWSRTVYKKVRSKVSHRLEALFSEILEG